MSEHVVVTRADGLLTLRINRPEKKNALTRAMYSALAEALLAADAEPEVRAVLITGGAEIRCTFSALLEEARTNMEQAVATDLFGKP